MHTYMNIARNTTPHQAPINSKTFSGAPVRHDGGFVDPLAGLEFADQPSGHALATEFFGAVKVPPEVSGADLEIFGAVVEARDPEDGPLQAPAAVHAFVGDAAADLLHLDGALREDEGDEAHGQPPAPGHLVGIPAGVLVSLVVVVVSAFGLDEPRGRGDGKDSPDSGMLHRRQDGRERVGQRAGSRPQQEGLEGRVGPQERNHHVDRSGGVRQCCLQGCLVVQFADYDPKACWICCLPELTWQLGGRAYIKSDFRPLGIGQDKVCEILARRTFVGGREVSLGMAYATHRARQGEKSWYGNGTGNGKVTYQSHRARGYALSWAYCIDDGDPQALKSVSHDKDWATMKFEVDIHIRGGSRLHI